MLQGLEESTHNAFRFFFLSLVAWARPKETSQVEKSSAAPILCQDVSRPAVCEILPWPHASWLFFPGIGVWSYRRASQVSVSFIVSCIKHVVDWSTVIQSILTVLSSALPLGNRRSSLRGPLPRTVYIISAHNSLDDSFIPANCVFIFFATADFHHSCFLMFCLIGQLLSLFLVL